MTILSTKIGDDDKYEDRLIAETAAVVLNALIKARVLLTSTPQIALRL